MIHLQSKFSAVGIICFKQEAVLKTCLKTTNNILCFKTYYSTSETERFSNLRSNEGVPYSEREGRWQSMLAVFRNRNSSPPDISRLNPKYFTMHRFKEWVNRTQRQKLCFEQRYIEERHKVLGNDLASAHFIVFRGGAVRFVGHNNWIKDDKSKNKDYDDYLPNKFEPSLFVEALDCSKVPIVYEGLENILGLLKLKWLNFQGCPHFDDWCLDRITGGYGDKLEYLDLSDTKVTYKGLAVLYRCRKLKTLKVNGISDSKLFQLTCLLLQDLNENLSIEGVNYISIDQSENNNNSIANN